MNTLGFQSAYETLLKELEIIKAEMDSIMAKESVYKTWENKLIARDQEMMVRETMVAKDLKRVKEEREYVDKKTHDNDLREESLNKAADRYRIIENQIKLQKEEVNELLMKGERLKLDMARFEEEKAELGHQRAMLEKEKLVDRERKEIIDAKEKRIALKEKRLQALSTS